MKANQLLLSAIIAVLPFAANATQTIVTTQTPAAVGVNGTVNRAATSGPYQTATIGEHDDEHIATTAYVKGAYNDAIAAVNKVDDDKQVKLKNATNNHNIGSKVMSGTGYEFGVHNFVLPRSVDDNAYNSYKASMAQDLGVQNLDDALVSAGLFVNTVRELGNTKQGHLSDAYEGGVIFSEVISSAYIADDNLTQNISFDDADDIDTLDSNIAAGVGAPSSDNLIITTSAVLKLINEASMQSKSDTDAVATSLSNKRVEIYTTWDTNDTTQVAFVTASTQH